MFNPRFSWKRSVVILGAVALLQLRAQAGLPELPTSAVVGDTFLLVHVDASKLDPASLDQTSQALLGPAAGFVAPKMQMVKDTLKDMTDAGAESLTVAVSGDPQSDKPAVQGYIKLKAGTDHAAFQQKMREEQAKHASESGKSANDVELKDDGDFVVVNDKGAPKSAAAPDPDRAKKFAGAFSDTNKALTGVFIATDKIRDKMKDEISHDTTEPPFAAEMGKAIAGSQNVMLSITTGENPVIDLSVLTADEESGKKFAEAVDQGVQQLKAQADQLKQAGPQAAGIAGPMSALADALKPKQEGAKVSVSVDGKILGPAVSNMLPFIMGGHGGGPNQSKAAPGSSGGL